VDLLRSSQGKTCTSDRSGPKNPTRDDGSALQASGHTKQTLGKQNPTTYVANFSQSLAISGTATTAANFSRSLATSGTPAATANQAQGSANSGSWSGMQNGPNTWQQQGWMSGPGYPWTPGQGPSPYPPTPDNWYQPYPGFYPNQQGLPLQPPTQAQGTGSL